jgi:hypothetical protein
VTSGNADRRWALLLIPIAIPAASSIWVGWTEIGIWAGMGVFTLVLPASMLAVVAHAGLLQHTPRTRGVQSVRRAWFGSMIVATAGTGLGAVLAPPGPHGSPGGLARLVWVIPPLCLAVSVHLYRASRKEVQSHE